MKKITIALLLSLYVLVCQAYDFQVDGIYYVITSSTDKTAAVTYNDGYKYTGNVEIPVRVPYRKENFLITSIGSCAFENCRGLTNITTFNSVTSIGMCAFSNTGWYNNQPDGILYLDKCCLGYKGEKPTGTLTLRDDTRLIAGVAFEN